MKMLKVSLAAIAMLIAFQQPMDSKKVSGPETLKVVSFNIRNGEASDGTNSWIYRYPATALMIEDQKPDIMGLQEAYSYQVSFITENLLNYEAVGVGREDGRKEGEHMSILYNKKTVSLKKWGTFWLSDTPDEPSQGWDGACKRTATWALMKDKRSGNSFLYVNTHLDHVGKEAQKNGEKNQHFLSAPSLFLYQKELTGSMRIVFHLYVPFLIHDSELPQESDLTPDKPDRSRKPFP